MFYAIFYIYAVHTFDSLYDSLYASCMAIWQEQRNFMLKRGISKLISPAIQNEHFLIQKIFSSNLGTLNIDFRPMFSYAH